MGFFKNSPKTKSDKLLTHDKKIIALAGNPNVGKSSIFNGLTGMKQHTGNWAGKTVGRAMGNCKSENKRFVLADIPGTYSLMSASKEEELARNYICFGNYDNLVVICDGTALERNLILVLQTMEVSKNVIVCINLMDEVKKKHISIDTKKLSQRLNCPVIETCARKKSTLKKLVKSFDYNGNYAQDFLKISYGDMIEKAISMVESGLAEKLPPNVNPRWIAIKFIEGDEKLIKEIEKSFSIYYSDFLESIDKAKIYLAENSIDINAFKKATVSAIVNEAESICRETVDYKAGKYSSFDRKMDKFFTGKYTAYPVMILFLMLIFWITIRGANYPSQLLSEFLFFLGERLDAFLQKINTPNPLKNMITQGVYKVPAWVVSVMLPPMAIFFPLFTLLEDFGYLPRIAYNLDKPFKKCGSCGKHALTTW